jgi:hypothetical protein
LLGKGKTDVLMMEEVRPTKTDDFYRDCLRGWLRDFHKLYLNPMDDT